ncbi:MAG: cytochrome c peroxidase, partial [Planctomycetia bacterium]
MKKISRPRTASSDIGLDSTVSCASCHDPAAGYSAHTKTGVGIRGQLGGRNSP